LLLLATHRTGDVVALRAFLPVDSELMQDFERLVRPEPAPIQPGESLRGEGLFNVVLEVFYDMKRGLAIHRVSRVLFRKRELCRMSSGLHGGVSSLLLAIRSSLAVQLRLDSSDNCRFY